MTFTINYLLLKYYYIFIITKFIMNNTNIIIKEHEAKREIHHTIH